MNAPTQQVKMRFPLAAEKDPVVCAHLGVQSNDAEWLSTSFLYEWTIFTTGTVCTRWWCRTTADGWFSFLDMFVDVTMNTNNDFL